jgi:hypothetical protein
LGKASRLTASRAGGTGTPQPGFRFPKAQIAVKPEEIVEHPDEPRFEFRVFRDDVAPLREAMRARASRFEQATSSELYIVTRLNIDVIIKLREGRLDVKELVCRQGLLEQWRRVLNIEPPVPGDVFKAEVASRLGFVPDLPDGSTLDEAALLGIARIEPALRVAEVAKDRTVFDIGACRAEVVDIAVGSERLASAAIDAAEAGPVEVLMQELGIAGEANVSYAARLQKLLF